VSFPTYGAYRNANLPWISKVPEHWKLCPLKTLLSIENGADHSEVLADEGWPVFGSGGAFAKASQYLYDGETILLGRKGTIDKPLYYTGRFWTVDTMYWSRIKPGCNGRYAYYSCLTIPFGYYQTSTALPSMTKAVLGCHATCLPPFKEQVVIATFLDRETAKIDALIAEQQHLIELLQEKRQAVISHAVTKGLNPNAPMKDSGVEWLGEVPEHWTILPVWMLFFLGRGRVISHEDIASSPGDYPVYSSQTERDGEMGRINTFDFDGDYLTWTTDGANAGSVFRRAGRFNCTNVCGTLKGKPNALLILEFAFQSLRLATASFVRMDINPKLMNNVMASIKIPVPPLEEQQSIALHISQQTEEFEPLKAAIDIQLQLLKERRSALISAAVTGQIDVRGLVPEAVEQ